MSDDRSVVVSVDVEADPETAFVLFTADVDAWWQTGPKYRFISPWRGRLVFEPGVGGRFMQVDDEAGGASHEVGRILVWEPGRRLVFEWRLASFRAGQVTEVEVRFAPCDGGTRIRLEHRGWQRIPADHPARHGLSGHRFVMKIGHWWAEILSAHKRYTESARADTEQGAN